VTDNTSRKNIDSAKKWDPSAIFDSPGEWDDELASLKGFDVPDEQIIKTPVELASLLEEYDDLSRRCGRLWAYARVRSDEDTTDSTAQARLEKVNSLLGRLNAFASVLESRMRQFDEETLVNAPVLEGYDHYIRDVFRRAGYTLKSDTREAVEQLQPVLDAPDSAFRTFMNGDYDAPTVERPDGESVTVSPSDRDQWLRHQNRDFRRAVHEAYCEAFDTAHDLLADAFGTAVD
jgi:oligoendopeptidase F